MSQDSAAPEAARKLSGRRRREVVAVLLFSGGPIFESSIPLSVFGIDRQDAGVPRYRLLVCGGEEGPLRTTGGLELTAPYDEADVTSDSVSAVPTEDPSTAPVTDENRDSIAGLDPDYDPLAMEKSVAWASVGGSIVLIALVLVLRKIIPKGRKRGWRPGTRKPDNLPVKVASE